jgi:hypothetical protein
MWMKTHWITVSVMAMFFAGCGSNDITNPNQIVFPTTNVSFAKQVEPYLNLACSEYGCHNEATSSNDELDLTSWVALKQVNGVANSGDTNCYLVLVMYGRIAHAGSFPANDNQRQGIRQWIIEGAQNN